ncbi:MAG: beta-lactamase family protein [Proteobacteria bacterium]|nr:beta-lactamase family protein [Pseudomonadota bacterium]
MTNEWRFAVGARVVSGFTLAAALLLAGPAGWAQAPPTPGVAAARPPTISAPDTASAAAHPAATAHAGSTPTVAPPAPPRPGARLAPGDPIPPAELEAFVDGVVRQAMAHDHIAGATVSIVQRGQVLLKKGYGAASFAPYRPVDPDATLFRIGSVSKTFTWILVLKQVEAGHMRLDAPVNLYLPEALRVRDQGFSRQVQVQNLMNHTAGFEDRSLGQLFERDFGRLRTLQTYLRQERPRRVREPGAAVSYSNYGAALAGAAVAEVAGKPYESLVESEITGPLALAHTTFREPHPAKAGWPAPMPAALAQQLAQGYRWTPAGYRLRPFEYIEQIGPAGAASTTAADMSRYMLALMGNGSLDGVSIYGPATAIAFSTPQPAPAPGVPAWRHGLAEIPLSGGFQGVGHSGGTLSFFSNMVLVPELGLGVFISTNTDTGAALADALPERVVQRFYAGPPPPPGHGSRALTDDRRAFEGVYLTDRRPYGGIEGFVYRLIGAETVRVGEDGKLLLTGGDVRGVWSPDGPPDRGQFRSDDGPQRLVFDRSGGRARRFFAPWGGLTFERVGFWSQAAALVWATVLVMVAAISTLGGVALRLRRDFRETSSQRRASLLQSSQSVLWIVAASLFAGWAMNTGDVAQVMYDWPGWNLLLASTCALVAALMSIGGVILAPFIWRGGRRLDGWGPGRKVRYTTTALIFLGYAILLGFWGALEPWSA